MNKAFFIGNLVRDPELRMMSNGKPRCTFTLAVNRQYKNANGGRDADFISVTCYEQSAELAQRYLAKGRKVQVECHVKTGSYEKDDGKGGKQRIFTTEFIMDNMEFLSAAKADAEAADSAPAAPAADYGFTPTDDELPF